MNPRVTGLLFLLAAALGAFVWFYEIEGEEGRKASELATKRLFPDAEADKVEWIALTTADGQKARLERREGAWRLVAPVEFRADAFAVDGMASALAQITSEATYAQPQGPEVYGLGEGAREVAFGVGGKEFRLRVGSKTPIGGNSYVSVGDNAAVYAVATYRVGALGKRLDELRDKRIVEFATDAVQGLVLRWPDQRVALQREEGAGEAPSAAQPSGAAAASEARSEAKPSGDQTRWRLAEPVLGTADAATVDSALSNLSFLRATGFEDKPPPDAESGLDHPDLEIEIALAPEKEGGEPRHLALAFGKRLSNGDRLVRAAGPVLFRVPSGRIDDYPHKLVAWRFKDVAHFAANDARRVEMAFLDTSGLPHTVTATRGEDEQWSSTPEAIDSERIRTLVDELARLRARDILADSMGADELRALALEPPNARIVVRGADPAAALAEVRLGAVRDGGGITAQAAGNPTVFELDPSLAEYVPVSVTALREHFVAKPEQAASSAPEAEEAAPESGAAEDAAPVAEPPAGESP